MLLSFISLIEDREIAEEGTQNLKESRLGGCRAKLHSTEFLLLLLLLRNSLNLICVLRVLKTP